MITKVINIYPLGYLGWTKVVDCPADIQTNNQHHHHWNHPTSVAKNGCCIQNEGQNFPIKVAYLFIICHWGTYFWVSLKG